MAFLFVSLNYTNGDLATSLKTNGKKSKSVKNKALKLTKKNGRYTGKKIQYYANATGKNKLIYDEIVDGLKKKETISKIAKNAGVTRKTVYRVKRDLGM